VWPPLVVVRNPLLQDGSEMALIQHNQPSKHSRLIVPPSRWQNALACGQRTGVITTVSPIASMAPSTTDEYMLSRSWIRNRSG
jgi:hypothetical protein